VFNVLDEDGSGQIEYKELNTILRQGTGSTAADKAEGPKVPKMPPGKAKSGAAEGPRTRKMSVAPKK